MLTYFPLRGARVRVPLPALMLDVISRLYEKVLTKNILDSSIPINHILFVLDEMDLLSDSKSETGIEKLEHFIKWCQGLKINLISIYVSIIRDGVEKNLVEKAYSHFMERITKILNKEKATVEMYTPEHTKFIEGDRERKISISIGLGGKSELTKAIKGIAKRIRIGEIEPEEVNEKLIESELIFKSEPDLVIRSGTTRLTDFLIWQSVYSEFYFTDVNWANFRKIDLLRAVRDFQLRERRFGR